MSCPADKGEHDEVTTIQIKSTGLDEINPSEIPATPAMLSKNFALSAMLLRCSSENTEPTSDKIPVIDEGYWSNLAVSFQEGRCGRGRYLAASKTATEGLPAGESLDKDAPLLIVFRQDP